MRLLPAVLLVLVSTEALLAAAPAGDWWNAAYPWRRRLQFTNLSGTSVPAGTLVSTGFSHAELLGNGQSLPNGDDIRIVYWNGSAWTELSRALAENSNWDDSNTELMLKLQAAIGSGGDDDNYYLYFGNLAAGVPPTSVPTARWYKTEQLAEQSTASASFVDVPGSTLTFTPGNASETWLVLVSGVMRSNNVNPTTVEMQLNINGAAASLWGHQTNNGTAPNGAGFLIPERITGTAATQTVQPQFRAAAGTSYVSSLRVVAALVPPGADFQFAETDAVAQQMGSNLNLQALTFTPSSAGDYLILGSLAQHENPGGSTVQCWLLDDGGQLHPDAPAGTRFSCARAPWQPFSAVFRRTLPVSSRTFSLRGTSSGGGVQSSEWRYRRIMALRTDAWESAEYSESLAQSTTTANTFQTKNSLTTAVPPAARDYLVIQSARISGDSILATVQKSGELREDGSALIRTDHRIDRDGSAGEGYHHIAAVANAKRTDAAVTYENGYLSPNGVTVECAESTICALRYHEPDAALDADEEAPTVTFTTASQMAAESIGTMTITAQFSSISAHDVIVPFTVSGTASNPADYTITASPLTIPAGSNTADITITVVNDALDEPVNDETVIVTMGTPTGALTGGTTEYTATIQDNDVAGVTVTQSGGTTAVTEGGATDSYTIVLNSQPTADVVITVTPDGESSVGAGAGVARQLTFNSGNWSAAQTITVTAYNDPDIEGPHTSSIVHTATSSDSKYSGTAISGVTANITDNDVAGVTIVESGGSTQVTEGGATDTYTLALSSRPVSDVVVTVTPDANSSVGSGAGVAREFTFTYGNWNIAQTVTVTATNDPDVEGPHSSTITHTTASGDANYNGIAVANVTASITDNDTAGVIVTQSGGTTNVVEGGATDTYTVVLQSRPTTDVTITATPDAQASVGLGGGVARQLTFTYGNWNTPQTITVTAVNDTVAEGAHTATIGHTSASADGNYSGLTVSSVTANITDNDIAYVNFSLAGQSASEDAPAMTVDVTLSTQAGSDISVPFTVTGTASNPDDYTITASPVVIPAGQLSATITITLNDDFSDEADETVILTMGNPSAGTKGTVTVHTATIGDNELPGVTVTESGGTTTVTEGGATDTYTLVLQSRPDFNVTVSIATDGNVSVNPVSVSFNGGNWDTVRTITVTATDDAVAEGMHAGVITHTTSSGDPTYDGITVAGVTASITDNDTAGVTVTESGGTTNVTEGGPTDTYTVVLLSQPTSDVTIAISTDGATSVNPVSLTFTAGNWSTPRSVTVTAANDAVAEGPRTSSITHAASSADTMYDAIAIAGVTANITDNDTAGINIAESGGSTDIVEGGATDSYTIVLTSEPVADVTVTISPDGKSTVNPTAVTFSAANWSVAREITVTAVNDNIAEGAHTSSITHVAASTDPNYGGIAVDPVTANITDNETAGVVITESGGTTNVTEGGAADTYTVVLSSQPLSDVTVTVTPGAQLNLGAGAGTPRTLTFATDEWNIAQTVTVTAVNDAIAEGSRTGTITHSASSSDGNYDGIAITSVTANITDNDIALINFTLIGQSAIENSGTMTVTVTSSCLSAHDISVPFTLGGTAVIPDDYTITASPVTITAGNLSTTITITMDDDFVHTGDHTVIITMGDPTNGTKGTVTTHTATIIDNDPPGVVVTESGGATSVTEGGVSDTYTLVLISQPLDDVTITPATDGETTVNPTSVTFTDADWNVPKTITVTAVDDAVAEGLHGSTISHTAESTDGVYDGMAVASINVNITDNDTAAVTVTESGGSTDVTEGGASDTYSVVLESEPTAEVTITISPDADTSVNPSSLTFTPGDWSSPQVVTVSAVNDAVAEGPHTSTITHAAGSTDGNYNGATIAEVTANVTDNDTAGVIISESGGSTTVTEGGATDTYSVLLNSEPTGNVTVTTATDGVTTASPASLTFTVENWNTPQVVTVTAVNDAVAEGLHVSVITNTLTSTDGNYNGGVIGVVADVIDNDTAGVNVIQTGGSTMITEGGGSDSYSITLHSEPTAEVTITIAPDTQTDVGAGPGTARTMTFDSGNWSAPQTVTVTAVDDEVAEGLHTSTITHAAASLDPNYSGIAVSSVSASITDDDSAAVTVTESDGSTQVAESGATDSYTLVLTSKPVANVAITATPGSEVNVGAGAGVARVFTFTAADWDQPQTVPVSAAEDPDVEGPHFATILHTAVSADPNYGGMAIASVSIEITDNDIAGVIVIQSGGATNITEGGATDTYNVLLQSRPASNVIITATPNAQASVGLGGGVARQLTFTHGNWNVPQSVTVIAVDDALAEGPHTATMAHTSASADGNYNGIGVSDVTAGITDNDTAYVNFSLASQSAMENTAAMTVNVTLSALSTLEVQIPFTVTGSASDPDDYSITASPVSIPAGQWSTSITITLNDDFFDEPDETVILTMSDPTNGALGTLTTHTATLIDDEAPGVTLAESGGNTSVTEGGATDTYTLVLQSQPLDSVTITVTTDGTTTATPDSVTFTSGDWDTPQTITVTAVNDAVAEGLHASTITQTATSGDPGYNGVSVADVIASITDNDFAGVDIAESGGTTEVTEGGATDAYNVALTSEPTADVTITISTDGATTVDPATLTFTAADWSTPQPVTVTAVNDAVAQGAHASSIVHMSTSADGNYDGIAIAPVMVGVTDDDVAAIIITESGGSTTATEGGAADSYTIQLQSEPTAEVAITASGGAQLNVGAGDGVPQSLTFTAGNWNVPQTVTVAAVDDLIAEGPQAPTILHGSASADGNYDGIAIASVATTIIDNDTAGVIVTESADSTQITEAGNTDSYTLTLQSQPTADVAVTVAPSAQINAGAGAGVTRTVTFDAANWNVPQTIHLSAADDLIASGTRVSSVAHSAASADGAYDVLAIGPVRVKITDNDIAGVTITPSDSSTHVAEGGATDSYTIRLGSMPTADVMLTITAGPRLDLGAGPGGAITLTFTAADWDTPQTVYLGAVDDDEYQGLQSVTIMHSAASADAGYNGTIAAGLTVTVADNEAPPPPSFYTITRATSPESAGEIITQPDQAQYQDGSAVTLTAVPHGSYVFDHWEGDLTGTANPVMLHVSRPLQVRAIFTSTDISDSEPEGPEDEIVVTTVTRYGCGAMGAAPVVLLPLSLMGLKSRRRSTRCTKSGRPGNQRHVEN